MFLEEKLINHPVHISTQSKTSAFIPFCSFGPDLIGKTVEGFQGPVCDQFREKVVNGQVCFEADINQYKEDNENWEKVVRDGFSFIVDTNEEYDARNLIVRSISRDCGNKKKYPSSTFKRTDKEESFSIHLKTISK